MIFLVVLRLRRGGWSTRLSRARIVASLEDSGAIGTSIMKVPCRDPLLTTSLSKLTLPFLLGGHHYPIFASDAVLCRVGRWWCVLWIAEKCGIDVEVGETKGVSGWYHFIMCRVVG